MAERRPPGFNVDLEFYDSDEVLSIPRKIRASAVGVWTLAGSYSAKKLSDGLVSAEVLKQLGCTPAIRAALMATAKADGTPSPLWIDAGDGAIRFDKWSKWQRTQAEVTAYRDRDAARKRDSRKGTADPSTSGDSKMSARTSDGRSHEYRDPSTEYRELRTESSDHDPEAATDSNGRGSVAATPGAQLVNELIPRTHPDAVRTQLRIRASELIRQGHPRTDVAAALELWLRKPSLGPNALPSLLSEAVKQRDAPNGQPPHKMRAYAELAAEERANEQAQFAAARKELR